jgi:hypothetical protein
MCEACGTGAYTQAVEVLDLGGRKGMLPSLGTFVEHVLGVQQVFF